jgi:hypothetical protein
MFSCKCLENNLLRDHVSPEKVVGKLLAVGIIEQSKMIESSMKFEKIRIWATGMACAFLSVAGASALGLNDPGVMGTVDDGIPADISDQVVYVNTLLGMAAPSGPTLIGTETYQRSSNADPGSGSVTAVGASKDESGAGAGSGFEYVIAKYDGPNAGSVVFYFGGAAFNLPLNSADIWVNGQNEGYGLSHWTGFNPGPGTGPGPGPGPGVPDAGSTLALIGLAVTGLGLLRRKLS